jgi:hypothetical protein
MRIAARKAPHAELPKREQLAIEQQRAAPLNRLFPDIERLRIELVFNDPPAHRPAPSTQLHTLYPAAAAFFRFACPCADCDGDFDLGDAVTKVTASASGRKRPASLSGNLACRGHRFPTHPALRAACPMLVRFQLTTEPQAAK